MNTQPDFEELFRLLEKRGVEYMIVGGYAVAYHGFPRFTQDIDLFFQPTNDNVESLIAALIDFGFKEHDLPAEVFLELGNVLSFGSEPTRVDMLNQIDGVSYEEAEHRAVRGYYGKVMVTFIGFDDLIKNKKSTSRPKDKIDVKQLK